MNKETFPDGIRVGSLVENPASEKVAVFDVDGNLGFSTSPAAGLLLHEQTITSSELTNSGTTPVDLIPDPGVDKIVAIEKIVGFMEAGTTPYDDTGIKVKYGNGVQITNFSGTFGAGGNDIYEQQLPNANLYANQPIVVGFDADQVQGDAVLHLKIYYRIVEF